MNTHPVQARDGSAVRFAATYAAVVAIVFLGLAPEIRRVNGIPERGEA